MEKNRLEAFSDGVMAVVITIMVLELKVPHGEDLNALAQLWPIALSYVLSFIYVGIYWNNHHHMLQATRRVNGTILWWNLHLLFWVSLLPFSTGWMGENHFARWPTVLYGVNLLTCALAWTLLQTGLVRHHGPDSLLAHAIGKGTKSKTSPVLYLSGIAAAWIGYPSIGLAFFAGTALLWLIPDRRVERLLQARDADEQR